MMAAETPGSRSIQTMASCAMVKSASSASSSPSPSPTSAPAGSVTSAAPSSSCRSFSRSPRKVPEVPQAPHGHPAGRRPGGIDARRRGVLGTIVLQDLSNGLQGIGTSFVLLSLLGLVRALLELFHDEDEEETDLSWKLQVLGIPLLVFGVPYVLGIITLGV